MTVTIITFTIVTLSITISKTKVTLTGHYAECCYAGCHILYCYAEYPGAGYNPIKTFTRLIQGGRVRLVSYLKMSQVTCVKSFTRLDKGIFKSVFKRTLFFN